MATQSIVNRDRLHHQVAFHLVRQIVSGDAAPGDFLPSEQRLAETLGVSRTVIREALMVVSTKGLVEIEHGRGARVRPATEWNIFDSAVIQALEETGHVVPILEDLLEVRRFIEVEAAALAAERADDSDPEALEQLVQKMEQALKAPADYFHFDVAFHEQIFRAASNQVLLRLMEPVKSLLRAARMHVVAVTSPKGLRESLEGHRKILDAIRARDPDAARRAMTDHLRLTEAEFRLAAPELGLAGTTRSSSRSAAPRQRRSRPS